ncbi:nucleotidyltransferase family protein [Streptococcus sp. HF-100]|uniref:nucleotidyltransferase family protein n=1 Tax=Streptococcus sp. HF-100 TaxID=2785791 RepID=UPI00189C6DCB|nr:nucleotidyltransferase family protein [Streptococcus sp. HF-100]MBF7076623.1 nucleotidyltransferase family protein [Streptococcus sp. HF-100]
MKIAEQDILNQFTADKDLMTILTMIRSLQLKDSWLAAGSVRNFIWNYLSNQPGFDKETDVDVIFFNPAISYEETLKIETKLKENYPNYNWELKNQVYMHIHNPNTEPYRDSRDAMSKYPERCTAIGLRLLDNDQLELFAPYGLDDILEFRIASTPHFLEDADRRQLYNMRIQKKDWQKKWNNLQIEFL